MMRKSMEQNDMKQNNMKRNRLGRLWKASAAVAIILVSIAFAGCQSAEPDPDPIQPKPSVTVGTWIDTQKVAEKDSQAHPVTYRLESISRNQEEVMKAIGEYNLSGAGSMIGTLDNENLEFCLASYSVKFPKDFPQSVFGITDVTVPFEIVSATGGTIQVGDTIYQNLGDTWEIGEVPQGYDFHAGDTYHGQIIFIMVKGYSDYLIHEIKDGVEESDETYIKGE